MRLYTLALMMLLMIILVACGDTGTADTNLTEAPLGPALTETVDDVAAPDLEPSPTREG